MPIAVKPSKGSARTGIPPSTKQAAVPGSSSRRRSTFSSISFSQVRATLAAGMSAPPALFSASSAAPRISSRVTRVSRMLKGSLQALSVGSTGFRLPRNVSAAFFPKAHIASSPVWKGSMSPHRPLRYTVSMPPRFRMISPEKSALARWVLPRKTPWQAQPMSASFLPFSRVRTKPRTSRSTGPSCAARL